MTETYRNSLAYHQLLSITGQDEQACGGLLDLLEAEPNLQGLYVVLGSYEELCAVVERHCRGRLWAGPRAVLLAARRTCVELRGQKRLVLDALASAPYRQSRELADRLDFDFRAAGYTMPNRIFRGCIDSAPLWSAIGHATLDGNHRKAYQQLQAYVLVSLVALRTRGAPGSGRGSALKALISLAGDSGAVELALLPADLRSPEAFLAVCAQLPDAGDLARVAAVVQAAMECLAETAGPSRPPVLSGGDGPGPRVGLEGRLPGTPPPGDLPGGRVDLLPARRAAPDQDGKVLAQIAKAIARNNQHFPFALNRLSRGGLRVLLQALSAPPAAGEEADHALLHILFWLGWDAQRLADIVVGPLPETDGPPDRYDPAAGTMTVHSPHPCLKTPVAPEAAPQLHPRHQTLALPLPAMAVEALDEYLRTHPRAPGQRLFPWPPHELLRRCRARLQALNRASGQGKHLRLTIKRVQSHIPHLLRRHEPMGDAALATLVTGMQVPGGEVRVHYLAADAYLLAEYYKRTTNTLLRQAGLPAAAASPPPAADRHVGTPRRPTQTAVEGLVRTLIDKLQGCDRPASADVAAFVREHNLYTTYTAVYVAFAAGHRAVVAPILDPGSCDPVSGFAAVSDKDICGFDSTRMVWLADGFQRHLAQYEAYLVRLLAACDVAAADREALARTRLFYLEVAPKGTVTARDVRPRSLAAACAAHGYHAAVNGNRSLIKGNLQEAGCAAGVVELFLGHAERGEEGFTASSALHPADYLRQIGPAMSRLLGQLGFQPLPPPALGELRLPIARVGLRAVRERPLPWPPAELPGDLWQQARGKGVQARPRERAFTQLQQRLLLDVRKRLPELYQAPAVLTTPQAELDAYYFGLKRFGARDAYKHQAFLHRVLARGRETLEWTVTLPPRPALAHREKSLLSEAKGAALATARRIERALAADIARPIPAKADLRLGQILLSAALYGGLLSPAWMQCAPQALAHGLSQHGDCLWLDLWRVSKPQDPYARYQAQLTPENYRRWVADPTTQMLIYRWLRLHPQERRRPPKGALELMSRYLRSIGSPFAGRKHTLAELLRVCRALALTWLPPYLVGYACGRTSSASLPDERWLRMLTGRIFAVPTRAVPPPPLPEGLGGRRPFGPGRQRGLRRVLTGRLGTCADAGAARGCIRDFLANCEEDLAPITYLLCRWAEFLLSAKPPQGHRYKRAPLLVSTVGGYLRTLWDPLADTLGEETDLMDVDEQSLEEAYLQIRVLFARQSPDRADLAGKVGILRHFHRYLHPDYTAAPFPAALEPRRSARVSANLYTETDYRRALAALNWQSPQASRLERIAACVLILGYRAGGRRNELLGIRLQDVEGDDWLDLLIRPHRDRGLKTDQARRLLPLDKLLTREERACLETWLRHRHGEPGVTPKDYLFTATPLDRDMLSDQELMVPLRTVLKAATGDPDAVYHHGRHSFYTSAVARLMLRPDIDTPSLPHFVTAAPPLDPTLLRDIDGNSTTGQGRLWSLAIVTGHADVVTGLHSYGHLCDWLVSYNARHPGAMPQLDAETIAAQLGLTKNAIYHLNRHRRSLLPHAVAKAAGRYAEQLAPPALAALAPPPPAPVYPAEPLLGFDKILAKVAATLRPAARPQDRDEVDLLRTAVARVARRHPRTRQRLTANARLLAGSLRGDSVGVQSCQEARDALELLAVAGLPPASLTVGLRPQPRETPEHYRAALASRRRKLAPVPVQELAPDGRRDRHRLVIRHEPPAGAPPRLRLLAALARLLDHFIGPHGASAHPGRDRRRRKIPRKEETP